MDQTSRSRSQVRDIIDRLARINSADEWTDQLNPTQSAALSYLARANRFSRAPSQVAGYLAATRGTVSQTLKALARKGLIEEIQSKADRRWISYGVTKKGANLLDRSTVINEALESLSPSVVKALADGLQSLVRISLSARGMRPFGVCKNCRHFSANRSGGFCSLLKEKLAPDETHQICHEYQDVA